MIAKKVADENWDFYTGEQAKFWNGPAIVGDKAGKDSLSKIFLEKLEEIFHSYNVCERVVDHYVTALVGKPISISIKPKEDPDGEVPEEVKNTLSQWYTWVCKQNLKKETELQKGSAIAEALTQAFATGKGYLRLYRPKKFKNGRFKEWQKIMLHCPDRGSIKPEYDEDKNLVKATYHFGEGKKEVYELLDDGKTKITKADGSDSTHDYQGMLPVFEINSKSLLTKSIKQVQKSINKLLTMWDKNIEFAGFPLKVILNGQPPGHYETDAKGKRKFIPNPELMKMGADKILFFPGIPTGDDRNPAGYTNPSMYDHQPVDVSNLKETLDCYKGNAYELAGIAHLLAQGGDRISGKSRIAGKEDYISDLGLFEQMAELVLIDVLLLFLMLLDRKDEKVDYKEYEPVVDLNVSISTPIDEREQNLEEYKEGAMSRETLIKARGQDSNTEVKLIEADEERKLAQLKKEKEIENQTATPVAAPSSF